MKNNMIKYLACVAVALGLAATVQAAQITGDISMSGGPLVVSGPSGNNLADATTIVSFGNVAVTQGHGTYATIPTQGNPLTPQVFTTGLTFASAVNTPGLVGTPGIWSFWGPALGGTTLYDFYLSSIQTVSQGTNPNGTEFLSLSGMGLLQVTGYDNTMGTWSFSANSAGTSFSFSSDNNVVVPDGGTTALLLGAALSALGLIRRKLA